MSTKHEEKALQSILRGEAPEKKIMVGYQSNKKEPNKDGKTIESPLTDIMKEARMPWFCPKCDKIMKKRVDDKYWLRYKMCLDCWSVKETKMKIDGTWQEYEDEQDKLFRLSRAKEIRAELVGYLSMVKGQDIAQESGDLERWGMQNPKDIVNTINNEIKRIDSFLNDEITWQELSDGQKS